MLTKSQKAAKFKRERRAWRASKGIWPDRDPQYRAFVRTLPCFICELMGVRQVVPTEFAHSGSHGISQKAPDSQGGPLCSVGHHREGPFSYHVLGEKFFEFHGTTREAMIAQTQRRYDAQSTRNPR